MEKDVVGRDEVNNLLDLGGGGEGLGSQPYGSQIGDEVIVKTGVNSRKGGCVTSILSPCRNMMIE